MVGTPNGSIINANNGLSKNHRMKSSNSNEGSLSSAGSSQNGRSGNEGPSTAHLLADLSLVERQQGQVTNGGLLEAKNSNPPMVMDLDQKTTTTTLLATSGGRYAHEKEQVFAKFSLWSSDDQTDFVKTLIKKMCHHQHGQIDQFLQPILQRDFISLLPTGLAEHVLALLDAKSLYESALVSRSWRYAIGHGMLWRKLIERKVRTDSLWRGLSERKGWKQFLFISKERANYLVAMHYQHLAAAAAENTLVLLAAQDPLHLQHKFYLDLYTQILRDANQLDANWRQQRHHLDRIICGSDGSKGVYCLQYDDDKIISGLRDNTIKIWSRPGLHCMKTLTGHSGSVLCLQYDNQIIASGSSDSSVKIWDVTTGGELNTLVHHSEAVLHLRFQDGMLVTCSKDRSIAVWDMVSATQITIRRVLVGHRAAVNVVDFDNRYIVSASGDRTIKVWNADSCEFVRTLNGHKRGIACLQYRDRFIVSGSSDYSIRIWDIEIGTCLRVLEGHEELVRCIRFDSKRIVSGAYDGKIKIWDLNAALNPRTPPAAICIGTLTEHSGRVFRLQFDEFQIVSSSHDDTILIWDFLNSGIPPNNQQGPGPVVQGQQALHPQPLGPIPPQLPLAAIPPPPGFGLPPMQQQPFAGPVVPQPFFAPGAHQQPQNQMFVADFPPLPPLVDANGQPIFGGPVVPIGGGGQAAGPAAGPGQHMQQQLFGQQNNHQLDEDDDDDEDDDGDDHQQLHQQDQPEEE